MAYRLGIDLGTASIGVVALELGKNNKPTSVIYHHTHIFQEPVEPASGGVNATKASRRGAVRRSSRLLDRRNRRLSDISKISRTVLKIEPHNITADNGEKLHLARANAVTDKIEMEDLLRIFFRMAKRRGYSGGFKVKKNDKEEGQVEPGINKLKQLMTENHCQWLGQYLYHRYKNGQTLKLKNDGLYADRKMIENEFERIWETQSNHHPLLKEKHNGKPIKEIFYNTIFYQRPLKSVAPMVGRCPLEPNLPRAPMAQPAAQAFRIEKQIADLRWGMGRRSQPLSTEQKNVIRGLLQSQATLKFTTIYKKLEKAGCPKPPHRGLNFDRPSRPELQGDSSITTIKKLGMLEKWQKLDQGVQISIINFLADMGSPEEVDRADWHLQYKGENGTQRKFHPQMVAFINDLVDSRKFDRLSKMGFAGGRSAYSIKALKQLTEKMQDGLDEYAAVQAVYPRSNNKTCLASRLEQLKPTGNIVVDVALRQLRYVINKQVVAALGEPPAQIVVELTRDMGLGLKKRAEIENNISKNRNDKARAKKDIEEHNHIATSTNIFRWQLWDEQEHTCPYCNQRISLSAALDGNETNLEHIIPKTLTRVGRQKDHLVLAHRACNDEKANKTPWQTWGHDEDRWNIITERAKALEKKKQFTKAKLLTLQDWHAETITSEVIEEFSNRQYHETSWISKLAAQWLRTICHDVAVSRGQLTAHLRRIWGLNTVIPEIRYESNLPVFDTDGQPITEEEFNKYKPYWEGHNNNNSGMLRTDQQIEKRIDHRHHSIDALVIALCDRALYQKMANNYKHNSDLAATGQKVKPTLSVQPPLKDIRRLALEMVRQCNLTHKPDRYIGGNFFKKNPFGKDWDENLDKPESEPILKLTKRKLLSTIATEKSTPEKIRNILKTIVSSTTRKLVLEEFDKRILSGQSPFQALQKDIYCPAYRTSIKRVKVFCDSIETAVKIEFHNRFTTPQKPLYKYLQNDGYAYLQRTKQDIGKISLNLVSIHDAAKQSLAQPEPNTTRFFKGDTVIDTKDNKIFIIKSFKGESGGALILVEHTETREEREIKAGEGWRKVMGQQIKRIQHIN